MKAHRIILYLCLLTLSTNLLGQASVYGEINTTANTNSIIRAWATNSSFMPKIMEAKDTAIYINSLCSLSSGHCAACGKTQTSSLGIILQKLPISSTCTVVRGETMSQTFPSLINGPGITVKDSETSTKSHPPTITTNFFIVNCSK